MTSHGIVSGAMMPIVVILACGIITYTAGAERLRVAPIAHIQEKLRELAELGLVAKRSNPEQMEQYENSIREVLESVEGDLVVLLRQWIYCLGNYVLTEKGERRSDMAMGMQVLLEKFGADKTDMAYAFYPLLDTPDVSTRDLARRYLAWSHSIRGKTGVDFGVYESILKEELQSQGDLSASLVEFMYEVSPGNALLSTIELDRTVFGALHKQLKLDDYKEELPLNYLRRLKLTEEHSEGALTIALEEISKRPEWWIQLFVAEFVAQVPEVNSDVIRDNLSKSECPLVKKVLSNPDKYKRQSEAVSLE